MSLAQVVIEKAKREAEKILKEAEDFRKKKIQEAKKEAEAKRKEIIKEAEKEIAEFERVAEIRAKVEAKKEKLRMELEVLEELKEKVEEKLKGDEELFKAVIEAGKERFKNPVVRAGRGYEKIAKKLWKGKIEQGEVNGIEIGEGGIWISGDVSKIVEEFMEANYGKIVDRLFGELR